MRVLNEVGKAWRNYLYANKSGNFNDYADFILRVELINDNKTQIVESIISEKPKCDLVRECVEDIQWQIDNISDMIKEFISFYQDKDVSLHDVLMEIKKHDMNSYFYIIAEEWKDWGEKAKSIYEKVYESKGGNVGYEIDYIHDKLCEVIMDEYYN